MVVSDDQKLQVQQATDIVRLIGEQVALRPKGREFVCLCPFHDDKNPSMYVSPQKQIYKCFACGAGGDAYRFVMDYHKMTFPEALRHLADRAGIELKRGSGIGDRGSEQDKSQRERIADANEKAVGFFRACLKHPEHGRVARDYLAKRGISDEMVALFQLGVAPDRWDGLAMTLGSKGWDARAFVDAGLISPRKQGSGIGDQGSIGTNPDPRAPNPEPRNCYDRLRHRLIFPIFDAIGRPIAFGGRILLDSTRDDPAEAKYLNSPETALFNKSATLYGIHAAKKPIIDARRAVIVEGYTDVIACHQAGACNVVATLGTALTPEHVRELRKYAEQVVLVFDADEAGQKAADRAVEVFLTGDLDVAIAVLPEGEDPDSLMRRGDGAERWEGLISAAGDALEYMFARMRDEYGEAETVTGKQRLVSGFIDRLARLGMQRQGITRRSLIIQRLSSVVGFSERDVNELFVAAAMRHHKRIAPSKEIPQDNSPVLSTYVTQTERRAHQHILACVVTNSSLFYSQDVDQELIPEEMLADERSLYRRISIRFEKDISVSLHSLLSDLAEDGQIEQEKILTAADLEVEEFCNATIHSIDELLRSLLAYIRFMRNERERLKDRDEFRHLYGQGQVTEEQLSSFFERFTCSLRENAYPGRILGGRSPVEHGASLPATLPDEESQKVVEHWMGRYAVVA